MRASLNFLCCCSKIGSNKQYSAKWERSRLPQSIYNSVFVKINNSHSNSGQDGGLGRYTLPPHTTKRRTTTNLKAKHNHNCQKIKLHGSLTTKELEGTFIQTSRRDGDGQPGWRGLVARQQLEVHAGKAAAGGAGSPMFP